MAKISDLPQELVDKIVAEFSGDIPNLHACSLISCAFLNWSRPRLSFSVQLNARNVYNFQTLVLSSPAVAAYVCHLDILQAYFYVPAALLPVETLVKLPNVTQLTSHCNPFGFRHLSPGQKIILTEAARRLTTVHIIIHRLWTVTEWAALLNRCPVLEELEVHAELGVSDTWDTTLPIPLASEGGSSPAHLHTRDPHAAHHMACSQRLPPRAAHPCHRRAVPAGRLRRTRSVTAARLCSSSFDRGFGAALGSTFVSRLIIST
ncbi:hypothetical protein C8R43DRAFT_1118992 [Mycena crocata]|nr:hypothetical protein C8R43DRAFT_1118992 [Mycena crocata]